MKALVLTAPSTFEYIDYPDPEIRNPDDVLIRIRAAAICGSDVHGMDARLAGVNRRSSWGMRRQGKSRQWGAV